jgi:hypothetical protein
MPVFEKTDIFKKLAPFFFEMVKTKTNHVLEKPLPHPQHPTPPWGGW